MVEYKGGQYSDDGKDDAEELEHDAIVEGLALLREQERLGRIQQSPIHRS